jgi:hypothetical protein
VYVDDLDIPPGKLAETARRGIDRAAEESRRRAHSQLTSAHVSLAFGQAEWGLFAQSRTARALPACIRLTRLMISRAHTS